MVGSQKVFTEGLTASHQRTDISYCDVLIKPSLNDFTLFTKFDFTLFTKLGLSLLVIE